MKLFETNEQKAQRIAEDVYVGIEINIFECINFRTQLVEYFSEQYYNKNHDIIVSNGEEEYIREKIENLTEKDIADFFQERYSCKHEIISDLIDNFLEEDDLNIEIHLDNEEDDDDDEDWDDDDEEDCEEEATDEESSWLDEMVDPDELMGSESNEGIALDAIASKMRETA